MPWRATRRDSNIDIDLDLWARASSDNPVFYVQYAHARTNAILRNAADLGLAPQSHPDLLVHEKEGELLRALAEFPRVITAAAELREPHRIARYLEATAGSYHRFYDSCRVLPMGDEEPARPAPGAADPRAGDEDGAGQRPRPARSLRSRADVSRAHLAPLRLGAR